MTREQLVERVVREAVAAVRGGPDYRHVLVCSYCAWQVHEKALELLAAVAR